MKKFVLFLFLTAMMVVPVSAISAGVGDKAPDFTAASTKGEINLSDYLGKKIVVLAFYYKDFTGG